MHIGGILVIDCEQGVVVSAPPQCRFVALSYVWGRRLEDSPLDSSRDLDGLPNTIRDSVRLTKD